MEHAVAATAASAAPVTVYVAADRVDVQPVQQLLAGERNRLVVKAIVVVVAGAAATTVAGWRDRHRSATKAALPRLLLMSQPIQV